MYLRSTLAALLPNYLRFNTLWSWDDTLIQAATITDYLLTISRFFAFCLAYIFILHPSKCGLFATTILWCGWIMSQDGIHFDSQRFNSIHNMSYSRSGADLKQFVCSMQWMPVVPHFLSVILTLIVLLEDVYKVAENRTRLAEGPVSLKAVKLNVQHDKAFADCKLVLANQVTMAQVDFLRNNFVFFFVPTSVTSNLFQTTIPKVLRWAVRLSGHSYTCVHIPDRENAWADIITRLDSDPPRITYSPYPFLHSPSSQYCFVRLHTFYQLHKLAPWALQGCPRPMMDSLVILPLPSKLTTKLNICNFSFVSSHISAPVVIAPPLLPKMCCARILFGRCCPSISTRSSAPVSTVCRQSVVGGYLALSVL